MSTPTHSTEEESVSGLVAHEEAEQARVEKARAKNAQEITKMNDTFQEEKQETEQEERAKAQAELQTFSSDELPKIGEASVAARTEALDKVESKAKKELPKAHAALLEKAVSGILIH